MTTTLTTNTPGARPIGAPSEGGSAQSGVNEGFTGELSRFRSEATDSPLQDNLLLEARTNAGQAALLQRIAAGSPEVSQALERFIATDSFQRLDQATQEKLLEQMAKISSDIDPLLAHRRQEILIKLMQHLSRVPGDVNQGVHAVCASAASRYRLVELDPAEYARRIAGLVSRNAGVELANGTVLDRVESSLQEDFSSTVHGEIRERDILERIYDTAFLRLVTGNYDNRDDMSSYYDSMAGKEVKYRGVYDDQLELMVELDRGENVQGYSEPYEAMRQIQSHISEMPFVSLNWATHGPHSYHAVTVARVDEQEGRVYFYNPHGGGVKEGPGGRSYDPATGLESMSIADFTKRIHLAYVSDPDGAGMQIPGPGALPRDQMIPTGPIPSISFEALSIEVSLHTPALLTVPALHLEADGSKLSSNDDSRLRIAPGRSSFKRDELQESQEAAGVKKEEQEEINSDDFFRHVFKA